MDHGEQEKTEVGEVGSIGPLLKTLIRGGGGGDHDTLKAVGYLWLAARGYRIVDFEIGGFDVLGMNPSARGKKRDWRDEIEYRVVLDAKASMSDLIQHFRKPSVADCDIDGSISLYANRHYIIANRGVVKPDAVHDPWGLLEYESGMVSVTKECKRRAYAGSNLEAEDIAIRSVKFVSTLIGNPKLVSLIAEDLSGSAKEIFKTEESARAGVIDRYNYLEKLRSTFKVLYGYDPIDREGELP